MKKFAALCLLLLSLLTLTACADRYEKKLIGSWAGNGTLDVKGIDTPFEYAERITFSEGNVAIIVGTGGDESIVLGWSASDDTLTFNGEELSWGTPYTRKGDTLIIGTGNDDAVFTRIP